MTACEYCPAALTAPSTMSVWRMIPPILSINQHSPGTAARNAPVRHDRFARHPDVLHAGGELGRLIEGRTILDTFVEQHEVGHHARPHQAPVTQTEALGRDRCHAPNRVLKGEPVVFAPEPAGHSREC